MIDRLDRSQRRDHTLFEKLQAYVFYFCADTASKNLMTVWMNSYEGILQVKPDSIQLFRERLSEKGYATILKGIVGGFEFTVLQRNLKEWHERP